MAICLSICEKTGLVRHDTIFVMDLPELNIEKIGRMTGTDIEIFEKNAQIYGPNIVVMTYPFVNADEAQRTLTVRFVNYMAENKDKHPKLEYPFYNNFVAYTFEKAGFRMDHTSYREKLAYFTEKRNTFTKQIGHPRPQSEKIQEEDYDGPWVSAREDNHKRLRLH